MPLKAGDIAIYKKGVVGEVVRYLLCIVTEDEKVTFAGSTVRIRRLHIGGKRHKERWVQTCYVESIT